MFPDCKTMTKLIRCVDSDQSSPAGPVFVVFGPFKIFKATADTNKAGDALSFRTIVLCTSVKDGGWFTCSITIVTFRGVLCVMKGGTPIRVIDKVIRTLPKTLLAD